MRQHNEPNKLIQVISDKINQPPGIKVSKLYGTEDMDDKDETAQAEVEKY